MGLVRRFLARQIPVYVDGGLNIVDVRDIAHGHLLADERGKPGERYILGGRNFTIARLFADLARISGVDPPPLKLPAQLVNAGVAAAARARVPLQIGPEEVRSASLWWTYRSTKAKRELGFSPRPHEETLEEAVAWQAAELGADGAAHRLDQLPLRALGGLLRSGSKLVGR